MAEEPINVLITVPLDDALIEMLQAVSPRFHFTLRRPDEDSSLGDFVEDKNAVNPQEATLNSDLAESTRKVLATLSPREEQVLKMRFGIGKSGNHTLEEVGQDFEVTRERIRQIEAKALRKLRHPSRSRLLKSFVE